MPGRKYSTSSYRYGFNGKENDNEVKGEGNQQDYGMRIYDPRLVRFLSVDPKAELREWVSPYNFVQNNPIRRVDPTGALDGEYELTHDKDGKEVKTKVSNLGDEDGIDFIHHMDGGQKGNTQIVNTKSGYTNWIKDGQKYMRGYSQRDNANWETIYNEWSNGTGPENSLMYGRDNAMVKDIRKSNLYGGARNDYLKIKAWDFDNKVEKKYIPIDFGLSGLLLSGTNMTMQMMGSGGASFYEIGNNQRLVIITDQKTKESFYYHLPWINNISRTGSGTQEPKSTTNQTYIWIDHNVEE